MIQTNETMLTTKISGFVVVKLKALSDQTKLCLHTNILIFQDEKCGYLLRQKTALLKQWSMKIKNTLILEALDCNKH